MLVHLRLSLLTLVLLSGVVLPAPAAGPVRSIEREEKYFTRYAVIYYSRQEDLHRFAGSLGTGLSRVLRSRKRNASLTADRVDALTARVMTLLDMTIPGFRFSIRVYPGQDDLNRAYLVRTGTARAPAAFYDPDTNTIAVAADIVNAHMLAHEITHAVLCAWFPKPPPARTQEILARYVDGNLEE